MIHPNIPTREVAMGLGIGGAIKKLKDLGNNRLEEEREKMGPCLQKMFTLVTLWLTESFLNLRPTVGELHTSKERQRHVLTISRPYNTLE